MISIRKALYNMLNNKSLNDEELIQEVYHLAQHYQHVKSTIKSDLFQLCIHLTKIYFCEDKYNYWPKEICGKFLNSFPKNRFKSSNRKIDRDSFKKIFDEFMEEEKEDFSKILDNADASLRDCNIDVNNKNTIIIQEFVKKFMTEYLKTFTYRKRYTKEETVNLLKIARR